MTDRANHAGSSSPTVPTLTVPTSTGPGLASGPVLRAEGISRWYGAHRVLTDLSFAVAPGHRCGLVGENGIGKSTLLRVLAGVEEPDAGEVDRPADLAYLHQEPPFGPRATVADVIGAALAQVRAVEDALTAAAVRLGGDGLRADQARSGAQQAGPDAATAYALALARAEATEVWDADRRADRVLAGLGLGGMDRDRPSGAMSGGERSRLALAGLLVHRPSAVLLDEPTNHLDDGAAEFLAGALRELPGAVLLASHDRVFLDDVCTEILDLDPSTTGPGVVGGTFSDYRAAQRTARAQWEEKYAAEQEELAALRRSIRTTARAVGHDAPIRDRNTMAFGRRGDRVEGQVSRRVRDARGRLDELERSQVRRPPAPLRLAMPGPRTSASPVVLSVRDLVVPGRLRLGALDLAADAKLLVTGTNGSGKSTLLHVLAGDLGPAYGTVRRAQDVEVALLEQDVGLADDVRTPRALFDAVTANLPSPPRLVELGLIAPRDVDRPLRELSAGQRRRVVLALLVARSAHVLLLDEPTNHVSLALAEELVEALQAAPSAVVVATHDRWLRRVWDGDRVELGPNQW